MYGRINEMLCNKKLYAEYRDSESIITTLIILIFLVGKKEKMSLVKFLIKNNLSTRVFIKEGEGFDLSIENSGPYKKIP